MDSSTISILFCLMAIVLAIWSILIQNKTTASIKRTTKIMRDMIDRIDKKNA